MKFKKYGSIENVHRKKEIYQVYEHGYNRELWNVTEKVHGCFRSSTKILMADGTERDIASIVNEKQEAYVMGIDENGKVIPSKITNWFNNGFGDNWIKLYYNRKLHGGSLRILYCTDNHRFYDSKNKEYKKITEFEKGDSFDCVLPQETLHWPQKQVLIGKMLGDGYFCKNSVIFSHKKDKEEYVDYTLSCLGSFGGNKSKDMISGYGTTMARGRSICNFQIGKLFKDWDKPNGILPEIELSPISLAFWYMDDGSLKKYYNDFNWGSIVLSTCSFNEESCKNLVKSLNKIGIDAKIKKYKNKKENNTLYNRIIVNIDDANKFFCLIAPYVPQCMQYKLPERYRHNNQPLNIINSTLFKPETLEAEFIKFERIKNRYTKYDIETETHNYIANNLHVHNSNYSLYTDGVTVRAAKRTSFLSNDENFMGVEPIVNKYRQKALDLFNILKVSANAVNDPPITEIAIIGELFGGYYPNMTSPVGSKRIQKGVSYCPHNDFIVFDLRINGEYVDWTLFHKIVQRLGFYVCEPLFIGTFEECMEYNNKFESTIPALFNLPKIDGNYCEGVVIKPNKPVYFGNGSRVIFKNKNDLFAEVTRIKTIKNTAVSDNTLFHVNNMKNYITENRIHNVLSHGHTLTDKDFGKLLGLIAKDVIEDYIKDNDEYLKLEKDERNVCNKLLNKNISNFIRPHFVNIIDGTF